MHALHQEILPPSGVEFATSLNLTTSTFKNVAVSPNTTTRHKSAPRALCNIVVARSNLLRIYEVCEEPAPLPTRDDEERDRRSSFRRGTEAVEGEVEMDEQGEGFVNVGSTVKSTSKNATLRTPTVTRFHFVREHHLHGIVTGLERVKVLSSIEDGLDRLVVSFKDAKIALLEWSESVHDLITVSIHTYERAPQLMSPDSSYFRTSLRVDPLSRCVALSLPMNAIAILPFNQAQAELDLPEQDQSQVKDIPYTPSFILDLAVDVDPSIRNVIDFVFLPGFNNPTVAILFQLQQTWAGRLKEYKDTVKLLTFTMDLVSHHYSVITAVEGLPYDCLSLFPCSTSFGGVIIFTSNSMVYVDQSSRRVILPLNGWATRVSDMPLPSFTPEERMRNIDLQGSRSSFVDDRNIFIVLRDGTVYPVEFVVDGKTVSKLVMAPALARATIPSVVTKINDDLLFIGSAVSPSVLLRTARVEEEVFDDHTADNAPAAVVDVADSMELDDDDDLYGGSGLPATSTANGLVKGTGVAKRLRSVIHLSLCDTLPAYGAIADMAFSYAWNGDRPVPELVAATGAGWLGGFTLFQRDLPTRTKRKLHIIGGARGMWSIPIRQPMKVNGVSYERPVHPYQSENDTVIVSTDASPSPGLSRIASRTSTRDISITTRIPGTTIGAAPFFQRTTILQVMTNAIRVLEPDGSERQIIKDVDGNMPRPKIKACSICDPFALVLREDDTIGLFIGETERGKIRRKDMSPMGDKTSRYLAGCFFGDMSGIFEACLFHGASSPLNQGVTTTLQSAMSVGNSTQWLILVRPQGIMEIWTLPKLTLVFSTSLVATLQNVLVDSCEPPGLSLPQDPPRKPQTLDIDQILLTPLGETSPRPHLLVFLRSGQLAIYEIHQATGTFEATSARSSSLLIKFVKVVSRAFDIQKAEETEKSIIAEQKRVSHTLIPFVTTPPSGTTLSGVFLTGDRPCWILATNTGGIRIHSSGHSVVHSFTACSLWDSKGDFLLYADDGPQLLEWIPGFELGTPLPTRPVPRGRSYSNVMFDSSTCLIVAASSLQAQFASFDEDGNKVWEPDVANVSYPMCECSTVELISPDLWITMDGYEFASNEFVNAIECVTLETSSTEAGVKEFVAVGTTINRGEDLAVKGATYIFEIVEVVPDPSTSLKRWYKLRLRCRDDAKGPVTAICGFNGYIVSSMGQKIFVRAFDSDERLVGVAFLDVGFYVTSLSTLKNLLLIGDALKSIWFVAFQEEPYKLVVLGKDVHHVCVTKADFFFADGELTFVTGDEEGVIRMYEYNPSDPESKVGQHLLLRTEFHGQTEYHTSVPIACRTKDDQLSPQEKLIFGCADGSLVALAPVAESVAKRLQLLQGQLTRNIQHVAGLNPKALRIVRNDHVSKPLSKGILDGNLVAEFESLPITRQAEMTRQIGTERTVILRDWISLSGAW